MIDRRCCLIRSKGNNECGQRKYTWNGPLSQEFDQWSALSSCRGLPESFGRKHLGDWGLLMTLIDEAGGNFQDPAGVAGAELTLIVFLGWLGCVKNGKLVKTNAQ